MKASRPFVAWLLLGIQIALTWAITAYAPPSLDAGSSVNIPNIPQCDADKNGHFDATCAVAQDAYITKYLSEHDVAASNGGHGPIQVIEFVIALAFGTLVLLFSRSGAQRVFAILVYCVALISPALGGASAVGIALAIVLAWWLAGRKTVPPPI